MDILDKLKHHVTRSQFLNAADMYEELNNQREEAAHEIERLRNIVNAESDIASNYFEGIEDIKQDLEDFANNPPIGDLENDRVRIAGMADQCADILNLIEKTMHHRKTTSEFCIAFMEIMQENGINPNSTEILNAWKRAENKKVTALEQENNELRKQVEAMQWRPISEAPREEKILAFNKNKSWFMGVFFAWVTDKGIQDTGRGGRFFCKDEKPTHFMPLPPAPEGE